MSFLRRYSFCFIPLALLLTTAVALLGWTLYPDRPGWFVLPALCLLLLLVDRINDTRAHPARAQAFAQTQFALRLFGGGMALIVATSLLLLLAVDAGLLAQDWSLDLRRMAGLASSAALIVFGNFLPKLPSPWQYDDEPFDWQGVHRFAGLIFMLGGSIVFVGWLLLPLADARVLGHVTFLIMVVVAVGRKWYSLCTWPGNSRSGP